MIYYKRQKNDSEIIHDLEEKYDLILNEKCEKIISANGKYAPCQGCFGCWTKHPTQCFMKDMEKYCLEHSLILKVYALSNGGFIEGCQNKPLMQVLENFCIRSNIEWWGEIYTRTLAVIYIHFGGGYILCYYFCVPRWCF